MFLIKSFIIFAILFFCLINIQYIYQRYKEKPFLLKESDNKNTMTAAATDNDSNNFFLHYDTTDWLKNNRNLIKSNNYTNVTNDNNSKSSLCKGIIVEIDNNKKNCNNLSQNLCDGNVLLKKVTIPANSTIDFYSHTGYKLIKGQSYCIYKPPPVNNNSDCNETWGFWKYSLKYEMWRCKSKVPGIYNEEENKFDPCGKGNGSLYYNGHYLPNDGIFKRFSPEQFYSLEFQRQFKCDCPRGYISKPELSRTTCFKDPCLINLPPHADAVGYETKTGNCKCTPFFKNLYPDNPKSPCTMCPDAPVWDYRNNDLILYVKCGSGYKFNCLTEEDKIRGCVKTKLKIKIKHFKDKFKNIVFF